MSNPLARALVSGTVASVVTSAALMLLSRGSGRPAAAPINATSHWAHGDRTATATGHVDARRTLLGYATHHAASVFWAYLFERVAGMRRGSGSPVLLRDAAAITAVAAVVDYGLVPKRLSPGWELVLPKPLVASTYAVMALGLAAGGYLSRRGGGRR
jgi:hypothetical protein